MIKSPSSPTKKDINNSTKPESETIVLDVNGMKCAGCVKAVERQLEQNTGVISACVNLITEVAVVEYEAKSIAPETLADKLTKTGFPSQLRQSDRTTYQAAANNRAKRQQQSQKQARQLVTAGFLLFFSSVGHLHHLGLPYIPVLSNIWIHFALATLALLIPGRSLLVDGWRSLAGGMPNMNTLVGLGTTSAYLASCWALFVPQLGWECFFDEPVMLLGFILLGRTLEGKARNRASAALEKLVSLQPPLARLIGKKDDTETIEIPVDRVKLGEWLRVLPGEKIPVDGAIVKGETTLDESMLTGESVAVVKAESDLVYAGTINQSGVITIEVTGIGKDTTLAKIINLVEDAQTRKAPVQKLADSIAGYFAYGVMAIATLTFGFWYFYGTKIWDSVLISASYSMAMPMGQMTVETSPLLLSLKLAIAVLVVACPCALGLATPTAILVGTSIGAENGILIKGGDILERVEKLDTLVFDKTGTLTIGKPQVTDCISWGDMTSDELLQLAASVESGSNHPLAKAIISTARQKALSLWETNNFKSEIGRGLSAMVMGKQVLLGNELYLTEKQIEIANEFQLEAQLLAQSGKTIVYLALEDILQGIIAIEDTIRPDASKTIEQLKNMGLNIVLLTGDRAEVAQAVGQQLKIEQIFWSVKPGEKAEIIKSLQQNSTVATIGDGINDAPALAQADVGISLQDSTDVAIATADIVLMQNQLSDIIRAIKLSQVTVSKIKQNLIWALAYNVLAIPIAAGILLPQYGLLLSPVLAAIAMASSSIIVVTNSLLLNLNKNFEL
ncbi:copper-translocating P-type ATPase [Waterburya agarophytonicola K14]|uniref:Copper-translocating P-type ATPase n=1 Tax=Waterburya agarophytonicola KI4 TaxID=2874699 RepID=A0A964BNL0_9CYAN|nr:heavy metal translocating P-type ATPase [Waterburya agarophytonicola]MCC0176550.1 copper-translocating P-type ATPase [Waterburya agarophytonicola KI4]